MRQQRKLIRKQYMMIPDKSFQTPMWNILRLYMEKKMM